MNTNDATRIRGTLALIALVSLLAGCRCRSGLESDRSDFQDAGQMARQFWLAVIDGQWDVAEQHLATDAEIEAALRIWADVMGERPDDAAIAGEVKATRQRLDDSWQALRSGRATVPPGLTRQGLAGADIIVGNKMVMSPGVCYIQRLTLTSLDVDAADARVAGAVKVAGERWKIMWLPY